MSNWHQIISVQVSWKTKIELKAKARWFSIYRDWFINIANSWKTKVKLKVETRWFHIYRDWFISVQNSWKTKVKLKAETRWFRIYRDWFINVQNSWETTVEPSQFENNNNNNKTHQKNPHLLNGFEAAGLRVPEFKCSRVNVLVILLDFQCLLSVIFELNGRDKYFIWTACRPHWS